MLKISLTLRKGYPLRDIYIPKYRKIFIFGGSRPTPALMG